MIRLENVWKTFVMGEETLHALKDVSEIISAGEHIAIMGPSGSGKSTLLNILGCLDRPSKGAYFFEDRAVENLGPDELSQIRLHEIGFIFQSFHLIPRLDALANIELPMTLAEIPRSKRKQLALEALRSVGLEAWADHRPSQLSGGQKQRVAIARAIAMRPRLLLADEPTGNLDTQSGEQILAILEELNQQGITLAVVTHDPAVASRADRILALRDGEIIQRIAASEFTDTSALSVIGKTEAQP